MRKRILSLLLAIMMLLSLLPTIVLAADTAATYKKVSDFKDGGEYIIAVVSGTSANCLDADKMETFANYNDSNGKTPKTVSSTELAVTSDTIVTDDASLVFTAKESSGKYDLYSGTNKVLLGNFDNTNSPAVMLIGGGKNRAMSYSSGNLVGGDYKLTYNSGKFSASKSAGAAVVIFEKTSESFVQEEAPALEPDEKVFCYVDSASKIQTGKPYLLVSKGYAVTFNGSGNTVGKTAVTVNDGKIVVDANAEGYAKMLWIAGKSETAPSNGTYTFKNGDDYFARVSNENYAQTMTSAAARSVWQYDGNDLWHKNSGSTNYFVSYSNGFDVKQTSANSAELKLYILDDGAAPAEKTLSSIAITTPPTKTDYTAGESFAKAGMIVTATYSDSSTEAVTEYTVTPSGDLKATDTKITVSYGGKTAEQAITVKAAELPVEPSDDDKYLIISNNFALSSSSSGSYSTDGGTYSGFSGVSYTQGVTKVTEKMLWNVTVDGSNVTIMQDGKYLVGSYTKTGSTATGTLSLSSTQTKWTKSGNKYKIGDGYLTHSNGTAGVSGNPNVFSLRSSGNAGTITITKYSGEVQPSPDSGTGSVLLAFTSDVHNSSNNTGANRIKDWISTVESAYDDSIVYMGFGGDMGDSNTSTANYWTYADAAVQVVKNAGIGLVYTTGNHEWNPGQFGSSGNASSKANVTRLGVAVEESNYAIYCFGAAHESQGFETSDIAALDNFLKAHKNKPVFVLSHFPIHSFSGRATANAQNLVEVLNNYPNVIFLWGHNHTLRDSHYGTVYTDDIDGTEINFTYCSVGCMSDSENPTGAAASIAAKGLAAVVAEDAKSVELAYYGYSSGVITNLSSKTVAIEGGSPSEVTQYTVTFKDENSTIATMKTDGTGRLATLPSASKSGYRLSGWFLSNGTEVTVSTVFTADTTVTAKWVEKGTGTDSYLIISNGYALSSASTGSYSTSGGTYSGFAGVKYTEGVTKVTEDMLWTVAVGGSSVEITQNGKYLVGSYTKPGDTAMGTLSLTSAETEWTKSGNNYSIGSGYLTHSDGTSGVSGNPNIFSMRSTDNKGSVTFVEYDGAVDPADDTIKVGHSLTLGEEIGVNFKMTLPAAARTSDAFMEFSISGKNGQTKQIKLSEAQKLDDGRYQFVCYVNALQMADAITANYHYGNKVFTDTYSVRSYCEALVAKSSSYDAVTVNLIKAIADYGYYAQRALAAEHGLTVGDGKDHAEMVHYSNVSTNVNLSQYSHSVSGSMNGVSAVTRSLLLESKIQIKLYLKVDKNFRAPSTVTVDGVATPMTLESDGRYSITISGISAHKLGTAYTVKIGDMTIATSALAYAKDSIASSSVENNMKLAMAAMSSYFDATMAYRTAHPQ